MNVHRRNVDKGAIFSMTTQIEDGFITANGLRIHYRRWSSPADNPKLSPILLLHGLASSGHIWNLVAPHLNTYGYTVTALDQRGHGESEKPASGYDFETILADDAAALADARSARAARGRTRRRWPLVRSKAPAPAALPSPGKS